MGGPVLVPKGTVIVALDQVPGATAFKGYPEAYDELESVLVPAAERSCPSYAGGYVLAIPVQEMDDVLKPLEPLRPRPTENRLPTLSRFGKQ